MSEPYPGHGGSAGRGLLATALVLLILGCLVQAAWGYSYSDLSGHAEGSDDAYISFRYARNLVAGHGLVFNPGERVEGYTNLLYVLLLVPVAWLAPDHLYPVAVGLNILFAALAMALLFSFVRERLGGLSGGLAALALALCPPLWIGVASGLETPLVLCLQVALWIFAERGAERGGRIPLLAGLAVLSCLVRADGFLAPCLVAVYLLLKGRRRAALAVGGATVLAMAGLVAWRLTYYGWPLPNTYYAKVSGSVLGRMGTALPQLSRILLTTGLLAHAAALAEWLRRDTRHGERLASALSFPLLFAPAWVGYWIYVGGDVFYERFLLILFPMGTYALLHLLREVPRRTLTAAVAGLLLIQTVQLVNDPRYSYLPDRYDRWVLLGRHLARAHSGATLAIDAAGKVPYFSGLPTIDMLGLTDAHIAHGPANPWLNVPGHTKRNIRYVLGRRPQLIAGWIDHSLAVVPEMSRFEYEAEGYRIRYLVNTLQEPQEPNLIDVSGMSGEEIAKRVTNGYGYGVLERQ